MGFIIIVAITAMIIYLLIPSEKKEEAQASTPPTDSICNNTVNEAMRFIRAYISFCAQHDIYGGQINIIGERNDDKIEVSAKVLVFKIDGYDAAETIQALQRSCGPIPNRAEDILGWSRAKDELIRNFYGTTDIPAYFYDIEDYEYEQGRYLYLKTEHTIFTRFGYTAKATYEEIKRQILEIKPNAEVKVDAAGLVVKLQ